MRKMKDSGIEWIGEIPEEWGITRLKYLYIYTNAGEVIDKGYWDKGEECLYTCQKNPIISDYDSFPAHKRTTDSDLLLTRNATPYIFLPQCGAIYSNVVQRIHIMPMQDRRYIKYSLQCGIDALTVYGDTIPSYNMQVWNSVAVPRIPFPIQSRIAEYLDDKCGKIDRYIETQRVIIEKLKAYKQAVITEAVTKGLDPTVPMKDSGVEWIGEIPEGWRVIKFKHIAESIGDGLHSTPKYDIEGDYYFLNGNNIGYDNLVFKENTDRLNEIEYKKYKPVNINQNTILITLNGATYGKTSFYNGEKVLLGKSAGYITLKGSENKYFIRFYLQSHVARLIMELSLCGSTIANLSLKTLNEFAMSYPPLKEQAQIVGYLSKKCSEIDAVISKKQSVIKKLTEYKKSLIYEEVTGKREVSWFEKRRIDSSRTEYL